MTNNTKTSQAKLEADAIAAVSCRPDDKGCTAQVGEPCKRIPKAGEEGKPMPDLKHPHATRMAAYGAARTAAVNAAAGVDDKPEPGSPRAIAGAKIDAMLAGQLRVGDYRVSADEVAEHAEALNLEINARLPKTDGWKVHPSVVRGTGDEKGQTFTRFTIHVPAPTTSGRGRGGGGGRGRTPAGPMFTECARCHYQYPSPWGQDHCNSVKACDRRKAVNAAEAELGMEITAWNVSGHELTRLAKTAEAAIAAKRAELAAAAPATS